MTPLVVTSETATAFYEIINNYLMKDLIILLVLLPINFCISQTFVNEDNEWQEEICCIDTGSEICEINDFNFIESDIIDSLQYYVVVSSTYPENNIYWREEQGRVYNRRINDSIEYLVYDFNAAKDDTINIGYPNSPILLNVLDVDSVILANNDVRKRLLVELVIFPGITDYWVSGIGSLKSPQNPQFFSITSACDIRLECFRRNSIQEYGDCGPVNVQNHDIKDSTILIYPNPFNTGINIVYPEENNIEFITLRNSYGEIVRNISKASTLNLEGVSNGLYYLVFHLANGEFRIKKIVKS